MKLLETLLMAPNGLTISKEGNAKFKGSVEASSFLIDGTSVGELI